MRGSKLARAAKACKGRPGSAFRACVKSKMNGLAGKRRRSHRRR